MFRHRVLPVGVTILALATGSAAASAQVDEAVGVVATLFAIAVLLWVIGNLLTYHRYDSGGPKGGPIQRP